MKECKIIQHNVCVNCGKEFPVYENENPLNNLCQPCWDEIFGDEDDNV